MEIASRLLSLQRIFKIARLFIKQNVIFPVKKKKKKKLNWDPLILLLKHDLRS